VSKCYGLEQTEIADGDLALYTPRAMLKDGRLGSAVGAPGSLPNGARSMSWKLRVSVRTL